jgi:phage head maturation protease
MSVIIRGYAITFEQLAAVPEDEGGGLEVVTRGAFKNMLRAGTPVRLQFRTHDRAPAIASTSDGALALFEDDYGLGFSATLARPDWGMVRSIVQGKSALASVHFTDRRFRASSFKGEAVQRVERAEISHIAIVDRAVYRATCVWRGDVPLDEAPLRVRDLANRWERGRLLASHHDHERPPAPEPTRTRAFASAADDRLIRVLRESDDEGARQRAAAAILSGSNT